HKSWLTHIHAHTCIHTYILNARYMHTSIHTYINTYIHTYTHTYIHITYNQQSTLWKERKRERKPRMRTDVCDTTHRILTTTTTNFRCTCASLFSQSPSSSIFFYFLLKWCLFRLRYPTYYTIQPHQRSLIFLCVQY